MQRALNWLAWLGVAIVFIAAPVRILGWMDVMPVSARLDQYAMYASWVGLALVVAYALQSAWTGGRNSRYGMLALVSVGVGLAILVAVNYVASRQNKRWDFTANQQFTLSDQTTKLLQGLNAPAKLLVFDRSRGFERFRARLNSYEAASKNLSVEYVDVDRFPIRAREYDVAQYGTVVVEYMGHKERATSDEEPGEKQDLLSCRPRRTRHQRPGRRTGPQLDYRGAAPRQLRVRHPGAGAGQRHPERRHGARRGRPAHRPARARAAAARGLSRQGREAPGDDRSAR
jgi:hypothetical protein